MLYRFIQISFFFGAFLTAFISVSYVPRGTLGPFQVRKDTTKSDASQVDSLANQPYKPTERPVFDPQYRFGDPFSNTSSPSPLYLNDPSNLDLDVEIDTGMNYTIYEKIGDVNYRPASTMSFEEFDDYQEDRIIKNYWKTRSLALDGESAVSGRNLLPRIYFSPLLDRIFGGSYLELEKNGFVILDFGGRIDRNFNPSIPIRQQRQGDFLFDQQISLNVVGHIGEKLAVTANFDNNNSFDFENDLKVEYTGYEEDIIKKIEIGNVSLPLRNSLITGAQNLFGVKTQLQFGKLFVTAVASTQRGRNETLMIESGFQGREFEFRASDYDENKHFFLGHFFRENYERWLLGIPNIVSGINITRVEVYLINRINDTQTLRNFVAFMDLGEGSENIIFNPMVNGQDRPVREIPANNRANDLWERINDNPLLRDVDQVNEILESDFQMAKATDFERVTAARKLEEGTEYTVNPKLGYVSLLRKLQNDEVLAVSYEYTFNGQRFKVGELSEDYAARPEDEVIFLKLLRPTKINIDVPTWDLMMKNIYNLNASQVGREGFELRVIYRDDQSGVDNPTLPVSSLSNRQLIEIMGLDRLNQRGDEQPDGNFDFVEGITVDTRNGNIIFPVLEPFGNNLARQFQPEEDVLARRFVFDTLYETTKADAEQVAGLNKYFITGRFLAGSSSEIVLPGINIAENSVRVIAGNTPLTEGIDYSVDYNFGRVRILNEGILSSGKEIQVTYERADLFNFQNRTLLGTRLDYIFNDDFNIGATLLRLNEQPLISRVSIGDEPTRNLKYGLDFNYRKDSRFLTRMLDALPVISTKETSTVNIAGEFAQLKPGTSNKINGEGTSYIDDFEAAVTPFSLMGNVIATWKLASTPITGDGRFDRSSEQNPLGFTDRRAKIAWYIIDNIFYRSGGPAKPPNISDEDLQNHYVRPVAPQEIFVQQDRRIVNTNETIFDISYFPSERGQYNFNEDFNVEGPEANWGGITRAITSDVDFDKNNIEFLEFWLMDPFIDTPRGRVLDGIENSVNRTGGELIFNLGSVSEDVMPDERHAFENGLPPSDPTLDAQGVQLNPWGRVTTQQFLTSAFDNSTSARPNQDIGLDGLRSQDELNYYYSDNFVSNAPDELAVDGSSDDFRYYLGDFHDIQDNKILERYKDFNGMEGNSPVITDTELPFVPSSTNLPENEDINNDNTISDLEEYYEYRIPLRPGELEVGKNNIVDKVEATDGETTWYLFRIPIREPDRIQGNISGFKSIRYARMYLTKFRQPVVLRMAKFQMVGSQWRKFLENDQLEEAGINEIVEDEDVEFNISVVNIEENSQGGPERIPYVLPPGFQRDRDNTSTIERRRNEQSMQLCVEELPDKAARAVFKNVNLDLINYGRLRMFIHAQGQSVDDDEVTAFVRLGTDFTDNYYEIEVPLKITPLGTGNPQLIWPSENEIDIAFNDLFALKALRDRTDQPFGIRFADTVRQYTIYVKGRPDLSAVRAMMIGMRNPSVGIDEDAESFCIWVNELRVTDFDRTAGWAANARINTKLADFANLSASGRITTVGFGGIQSRISERSREETKAYDVSADVQLEKLLPENTGLKIPMFASYEESKSTPNWDPFDPDIPLEASLLSFQDEDERSEFENIAESKTVRRSLNFTNVRKDKVKEDAKNRVYDVENLSFTYAYSDVTSNNPTTQEFFSKNIKGAVAYNYNPKELFVTPFGKVEALNSPYLALIKDFNFSPLPSNLAFRADLNRKFTRIQYFDESLDTTGVPPIFEKFFTFNRFYSFRWNLTKSLSVDYDANANAVIDEPRGDINTEAERDSIWGNLKNLGRLQNFTQNITATYKVPLDKFPVTDWLRSDLRYGAGYNWRAESIRRSRTVERDSVFGDTTNIDDRLFGNIIENNRERGIVGKVDLVSLYNKVKILKAVNTPPRRRGRRTSSRGGRQDTTKAEKEVPKAVKGFLRTLMSLRSIDVNFNVREGTTLPGFAPRAFLFGLDSNFNAPGVGFIFGDQDPGIRRRAAENGWLRRNPNLTSPFTQNRSENLSIRAQIEPFPDLRVQLNAEKTKATRFEEIFRFDQQALQSDTIDDINGFVSLTPTRSGQYSISYSIIKTSFEGSDEDNNSDAFKDFVSNRDIIIERLMAVNSSVEYDTNSQEVVIPAFLAAYSGKDPNEIDLTPFPERPIPNWRVDYAGLSKIKALGEIFQSINITHGYNSSYEVGNFANSLLYDNIEDNELVNLEIDNQIEDYVIGTRVEENGRVVPVYVIPQVALREQFSPLIGINFRTKSRITTRIEFRRERSLILNIPNSQVTEVNNEDVTFEMGYTASNFKIPFRIQGRTVRLKNDITFRLNVTIRDTKTVQRKINDIQTITNGNFNWQFRPTVNYALNQKLNLQFFFERNVNEPRISNSFKRAATAFGVQVRYNLSD